MNANNVTADTGSVVVLPSTVASNQIVDSETTVRQESSKELSLVQPGGQPRTNEGAFQSDAQLIALVSSEPPDEQALETLVDRYWSSLFARCLMLTLNSERANDLAQSVWYRFLRARRGLKPDGSLSAYLATIATHLYRDSYRASRRAGPMADYRLESLDAAHSNDVGEEVLLMETVADVKSLQTQAQTLLAIDIDRAMEQLAPQLRDVIIARFINGESCAEIGVRHGRTEQTISGWIRQALRQMKTYLEEPGRNK